MTIPKPLIIDISEHQLPSLINYDKLSKEINGVIIRIQYGSNYIDKHYKTHINEFKKRNIPVAVYAWVRGTSNSDMETEAKDFYNRGKEFNPTFWWLDVEEQSMSNMREGVEKYRAKLSSLGAKKIGVYVANHLFSKFNLDISKFNGVWVPTYGSNNGQYNGSNPTATNNYNIHQYTSEGRLNGYAYALDLNRLVKGDFSYFFGTTSNNTNNNTSNNQTTSNRGINVKTITVTEATNLRTSPNTKGGIIALLPKNSKVNINDIVISNGYVWGVQPRSNNAKGYIALGKNNSWVK